MATSIKITANALEVRSFPQCVVALCLIFIIVFWCAVLFGEAYQTLTIVDCLLFNAVCIIVVLIQKITLTTFDNQTQTARITVQSLLGTKVETIQLSEIQSIQVQHGRGNYAKGGVICLQTANKTYVISQSDICAQKIQNTISTKEAIISWLSIRNLVTLN